jgi:tRNA A-37 threonylcarbamoyl transferase component Bud32
VIIGSTISHYRIVEKLGEGGMGVVYKAEDTKLERTVALKFLAQHLLDDEEAKERFLREAKAAAALHHSNVCPVYEIDEADGKTFLAMAFLRGETLEDRIAKGPSSIKDALDITRQVADGLEAAHEAGIVHRDIKPANVLIDPKGHATIMDFGLARLTEASRLTKVDTAMGTVAYMSPEQAQGMEVDSRTDIWALGCVLYEMVSGQRPFLGQYDQALLYEIVHEEIAPLTSIRAGVPMELEFVVGECLAKDRDDRTGTAQEVSRKLRTLAEKLKSGHSTILRTTQMTGAVPATMMAGQTVNPVIAPAALGSSRLWQALFGVALLALLGVSFSYFTQAPPEAPAHPVGRFSFVSEGYARAVAGFGGSRPTISPDGKSILYVDEIDGERSLWVRALASEFPRRLDQTEGAIRAFWSPDSQSIGFGTDAELKRMSLDGGIPITLSAYPGSSFLGGTWSPDGETIVFSSGTSLYRISARGGEPELLIQEGDSRALDPVFLPSATQALVFTGGNPTASRLNVLNLATGVVKELRQGDDPGYSGGYLIHGAGDDRQAGIWAMPFSLETLDAAGESFPIDTGGRRPTVSRSGILTYEDYTPEGDGLRTLVWRNRSGEVLGTIGQPQPDIRAPRSLARRPTGCCGGQRERKPGHLASRSDPFHQDSLDV